MSTKADEEIINATKVWLECAIIGLNLCPFAKSAHVKNQIHYAVSNATTHEGLLEDIICELTALVGAAEKYIDTTLVIHPYVLTKFADYNDFLGVVDAVLVDMGLDGVLQVASFHPQYQFAETQADDITNFTNRSPYPMMHILREDSVEKAVLSLPEIDSIYKKNIETMRHLGHNGWNDIWLKRG